MSGADGFARSWDAFTARPRTLGPSPGAREDWARGRTRYALWALRVAAPSVLRRMSAVAERLGDAIVPVPPADAHVTVWVSGFPAAVPVFDDDVAEAALATQREAVARLAPPRFVVGAPNAFATCAFLEVADPHGDLAALRAALSEPGAREVRFAPYLPHVTVGRFADTRDAAPIAAALATLRAGDHAAPLTVEDAALELIELDARAPDRFTTVWRSARNDSMTMG
jgi:2'-5' RNA ligase